MSLIVKEFVNTNQLEPVRILICGPPGSGKSVISDALARKFHIPVVRIADVIAACFAKVIYCIHICTHLN